MLKKISGKVFYLSSKKLVFLIGTPRSGNTLLGSILNQNKKICVTANSITFEVIHQIYQTKNNFIFHNFPDHESLDNVSKNVFNNYYEHWPQELIIERSPTALTPGNARYFDYQNYKFIFLKRNILDIVKSLFKVYRSNGDPKSDLELGEEILHNDFMLKKSILSILNGRKILNKNQYIEIDYEELINSPNKAVEDIYSFLNIDRFSHQFQDLKQIEINGKTYDDEALSYCKNMHKIRTNKITKEENKIELPQILIDRSIELNNLLSSQ